MGRYILLLMILCSGALARSPSKRDLTEDALQNLVASEPDNPRHWMDLGALAAGNNQLDLARGYFDEAIKLSGRDAKIILEVGEIWLQLGRVRPSLAYLLPNLAFLEPENLDRLQAALEREKLYSVQLTVLRNLGMRSNAFAPVNRKVAVMAFRTGDLTLCQAVLSKHASQLDYESARNFLLVNFFLAGTVDPKVLAGMAVRFPQAEIGMLVHLNYAVLGRWKEVRRYLEKEANSLSFRDYYHLLKAMEAAGDDRNEEAVELYLKAKENSWDRLRVVIMADLYRLYSSTGNKFKSDQVWETLKEEYQEQDPDLQEFMARQLQLRSYEKQAKYFYRVVLRRRPGNVGALAALWEDLMGNEDYQTVSDNIKAVLDRDPHSCEGNTMAMNFHLRQQNDKEIVAYARNATAYCYEAVEPYFVLGTALLNLSKPEEARGYFATYIRKGGDANKVPVSLR